MGSADVRLFGNPGMLTAAVAADFMRLAANPPDPRRLSVALSGGRIAATLFEAIVRKHSEERISLEHVDFFWSDERCVPPQDPESNFGVANRLLLKPLGVAERQIHRIRGEDAPEAAARLATEELVPLTASAKGQAVLDLVFLGMGEDGHVASLFPGEDESNISDPAIYRAVTAPKPPPGRVTLGYSALAAARQVWVLISGDGKKDSYESSLGGGLKTPLGRVLALRERTQIWTDIGR